MDDENAQNRVIIIGAGAAGLAAAVTLKRGAPSLRVTVLEKEEKPGKKILVSGNGRCNLTSACITARDGAKYYNAPAFFGRAVGPAESCPTGISGEDNNAGGMAKRYRKGEGGAFFEKYGFSFIERFYNGLGLLLSPPDSEGRVYPASNAAASVMDIYRAAIGKYGVELIPGAGVTGISGLGAGYEVKTADGRAYPCACVIYAAGSPAGVKGGDKESLRRLLNSFVKVSEFRPSLCPLPADKKELSFLENTRARCRVSGLGRKESGEVQFRKDSLSGIVIFNFACVLARALKGGAVLSLDLFPYMSREALACFIREQRENAASAAGMLAGVCAAGVAKNVLYRLGISFDFPAAGITEKQAGQIAGQLKGLEFKVSKSADFKEAQTAAGGAELSEVDNMTFEVKKHKGLYIAGEALDIDGECGGFNLHFAAASGIAAAEGILRGLFMRNAK